MSGRPPGCIPSWAALPPWGWAGQAVGGWAWLLSSWGVVWEGARRGRARTSRRTDEVISGWVQRPWGASWVNCRARLRGRVGHGPDTLPVPSTAPCLLSHSSASSDCQSAKSPWAGCPLPLQPMAPTPSVSLNPRVPPCHLLTPCRAVNQACFYLGCGALPTRAERLFSAGTGSRGRGVSAPVALKAGAEGRDAGGGVQRQSNGQRTWSSCGAGG